MATLKSQPKNEFNILNIPNGMSENEFFKRFANMLDVMEMSGYRYAWIFHDKDKYEDGTPKTPHVHLVLLGVKRVRLETNLYRIADAMGYSSIDEINTIQMGSCESVELSIQYLTHKNHPNKYQYDIAECHYDITEKDFIDYFNAEIDKEITARYLFDLVKDGYSDIEIMFKIGVGRYHLFKGAIADIRYALARTPNLTSEFLASVDKESEVKI